MNSGGKTGQDTQGTQGNQGKGPESVETGESLTPDEGRFEGHDGE